MPGTKRKHADQVADINGGADDVHPSRKQRLDDGTTDAELRQIFNQLREEIQSTRLNATKQLLKILSTKSEKQAQNLDYSTSRLIKGVCSGAKAARPGFSIALVEVLRLGFASSLKVSGIVEKITVLTDAESKASGDEKRNYLIGRRLALQAILQSGVLDNVSADEAKHVFDAIAELAEQKGWSRSECGAILLEFLKGQEGGKLPDSTARCLVDSWYEKGLLKSPEGVALWLTIRKTYPNCKLPKGIWHHNNPLASQERATLCKILLKNSVEGDDDTVIAKKKSSGARQLVPSYTWQVLLAYLYTEDGGQKFGSFWEDCVAQQMFSPSASTERKALGLQLFAQAITTSPAQLLGHVVHRNIIRCIVDQRAKPDRYLFEAAKVPLDQMVKRGKQESTAASAMFCKLLTMLPSNPDKSTKATIEALQAAVEPGQLRDVVTTTIDLCRVPKTDNVVEAEKQRRMLADILLSVVRLRRSQPEHFFSADDGNILAGWLSTLLQSLASLGFTESMEKSVPAFSDASQALFRDRLQAILGYLVDLPIQQAAAGPLLVVETLAESKKSLSFELDEAAASTLKKSRKHLKDASKKARSMTGAVANVMRAFELLLSLGMLQVYKQEPDSVGVLEDIASCFQMPGSDGDASAMIVELLLSFISKPSALFRKLAEQVFAAFAPDLNPEGLQSMIDILSQKESLAGQQELFKNEDEDSSEPDDENADEDQDAMDVEDASDVEIVNGKVVDGSPEETDSVDDDSDASVSSTGDSDEEAAFDRKLAAALGTAGMEAGDSDSDGSDMDDDQMMALEPHLTTIFQERKKTSSKKQDNKDAKANMINFKNRILDLLVVYVKSQYANVLALDLIHPLVTLTRTTTNAPTIKKAFDVLETLFDTSKKHKALPPLPSAAAGFELLAAVHAEMKLGGSKIHASACSRASQFLAKILVSMEPAHWRRIANMYSALQDEWRRDGKSKIHGSVFNDWHSWSMQRS